MYKKNTNRKENIVLYTLHMHIPHKINTFGSKYKDPCNYDPQHSL
jgi:hypothetical protein